ncbi:FAD-dependent oxidoreductase [Leucobacter allii]|uniref:FAD-dependent oxidoreductase n=1 Tax=Leucobacter allii TaxID=2932247 RepID=A0ABY4FMQ0_9MICO|nr:FAD-dependent oxidoreductase [Leucobacter allii]UOQ57531.1 FAD-dependent oxidoreductase [Leucobacter allii]
MDTFDTVIVGAGHAAVSLYAQLRKSGYAGRIGVFEKQDHLPYERPPLSKGYMTGDVSETELLLRQPQYWDDAAVELRTSTEVVSLDAASQTVTTAAGETIGYGTLVWATGASARELPLDGADSANVVSVRTLDDARRLSTLARGTAHSVIIGGGYIGLETASTLVKLGHRVTVLEAQERLLARVAGPTIAARLQRVHEEHGVRVLLGVGVERIETDGDRAVAVHLADGERLPADVIVVGVGVIPEIALLAEAGAEIGNGVIVDAEGRTTLPHVYAVGDIAAQQNAFAGGAVARLESVPNAADQAKVVAASIVGAAPVERAVPWFWSHQYELRLQTAGILTGFDREVVREGADGAITVGYFKDDALLAADCLGAPADFNAVKNALKQRVAVTAERFGSAEPLTVALRMTSPASA